MPKPTKTKTATTTTPKLPDPRFTNYMVKQVDRQLWARFTERAKTDGHSLAWLFRKWIAEYADGR
jgi:hypothetical protein